MTGDSASDSRARILRTIASSLGRGPLSSEQQADLDRRLSDPKPNTVPARAQLPPAQQVDLFVQMAEAALATVARIDTDDEVPAAVAQYLQSEGLVPKVTLNPVPELAQLPWAGQAGLEVGQGLVLAEGEVAVTGVFAAIAETGTLVITSGPDTPTGNVFLPETHIALVRTDQVVGSMEDGWVNLRAVYPTGYMPRTVNLVTGPSRTGDIEAVMYMGAHGPRRLHILVIG